MSRPSSTERLRDAVQDADPSWSPAPRSPSRCSTPDRRDRLPGPPAGRPVSGGDAGTSIARSATRASIASSFASARPRSAFTDRHFMSAVSLITRNCDAAMPCSSVWACALSTSRPCIDNTPAIRLNVPVRSEFTTVITSPSRRMSTVRRPCAPASRRRGRAATSPRRRHHHRARDGPGRRVRRRVGLPRTPCGGAGRPRVGVRQRMEQLETFDGLDCRGHLLDRCLVGEVAPKRVIGEEQMVLDHRHEGVDVARREPEPGGELAHDRHAGLGVIARISLADVVEQRSHHEQVRPADPGANSAALAAASHR